MLEIDVVLDEEYDEKTERFIGTKTFKVHLEHSLVSVSKWESVWEESFLNKDTKTREQTISYLQMMILDEDLPPEVFRKLVESHIPKINNYIIAKQTATKVPSLPGVPENNETKTAELIYYWMITLGIPMECQHWHLNRLLTLIRVVNFKNDTKTTKMSAKDRRALNKARLQKHNTRG